MSNFTVSQFYSNDHQELEQYFLKFQELKRVNYRLAKEFFKHFKFGLQRHIVWEEEFLYPMFEQLGGDKALTQALCTEHEAIKAALELLHKKVQKADPESDKEEEGVLKVFRPNSAREKRDLYPMFDKLANASQLEALRSEMESLPPERYKVCCNHHVHF